MERIMLIITQVVMGKYNVKFSRRIIISPGNLPIHGILPAPTKKKPMSIAMIPNIISDLPIIFMLVLRFFCSDFLLYLKLKTHSRNNSGGTCPVLLPYHEPARIHS